MCAGEAVLTPLSVGAAARKEASLVVLRSQLRELAAVALSDTDADAARQAAATAAARESAALSDCAALEGKAATRAHLAARLGGEKRVIEAQVAATGRAATALACKAEGMAAVESAAGSAADACSQHVGKAAAALEAQREARAAQLVAAVAAEAAAAAAAAAAKERLAALKEVADADRAARRVAPPVCAIAQP